MADYIREMRALIGHRPLMVVGAAALIYNENQDLLLIRRTDMNLWGLPAGVVEVGESVEEGLRREVYEETGLTVLEYEPVALYSGAGQTVTFPNGDVVQSTTVVFRVSRWEGEPRPDGVESSEVAFFSPTALPEDMVSLHRSRLLECPSPDDGFALLH